MVVETQRKLLYQLVKLFSAKDVLEIGTFTGTSAIAMALALSEEKQRNGCGGQIVSLEIDPKAQAVARKYIEKLGLDDCVDLRLGPGLESLAAFAKEQPERQFDFVFIDADKPGYVGYYDFIMDNNLLSDRGVIIADNVLFFGQVHRHAGYDTSDSNTIQASDYIKGVAKQMEKFNQHVSQDPRTRVVMLPLFDGMSIITKNNSQGSHPNNNKL
ncbi:O-methyltransferase [Zychaea mexicana]|uniref:O-methyltransferase n=1 Tax=Zychaea mexicana TaxID=64656 RepID=UPI0022FF3968|nr:O-methyltransferase [Zychaea mexicana]KAI9497145.1 O-methyltransferase [Zychaea mexicana]